MKTFWLALIVLLLLSSCKKEETTTIKIGVSALFTGFASNMGVYVRNGIELAAAHLPENERQKIRLIYEDDACDPNLGLSTAQKLVTVDDVGFIIGPFCAAVVIATADYYDQNKVVRMITGLGTDNIVKSSNYSFIPLGQVKDLMKPLAQYAYSNGFKKIAVIYLDDDYGRENVNYFEKYFADFGGQIVVKEAFVRGQPDFKTSLLKLANEKPDAIFVVALGTSFVQILKQLDELGISIPILGLRNTEDPEIIKATKQLSEGVIFPSLTDTSSSPLKEWFYQTYYSEYNETPESVSATAFDSFNILFDAINKCNDDAECVSLEISQLKNYSGASGIFSLNEEGFAVRQPTVRVVHKGRFETA